MRLPGGWELFVILAIVILIFGVGKIADVGPALGKAISGFRKAVKDPSAEGEKAETVEKVEKVETKPEA
jgi:sec-independent protein translocase protein TatA